MKCEEGNKWIRVTEIYGVPEGNQRYRTWNLMKNLSETSTLPRFIGGDFNEILHEGEKQGGGSRAPRQMQGFNSALVECGLVDLGYEGFPFTWSNGREHPNTIRCRLDRVCADTRGLELFPSAHVTHLEYPGSDHLPILLEFEREVQQAFS